MRSNTVTLFALGSFIVAGCSGPGGPSEAELEGRWTGELESGVLPSGSLLVAMEIDPVVEGEALVARVVFGEGAAPAPPTDPEVGWPPGIDPQRTTDVPVADGFVYLSTGRVTSDDRLRIDLPVTELWAPWCELQTPVRTAEGSDDAMCLPNRPWIATPFECHFEADETNPEETVDCLKLTLCRRTRVCSCTVGGGCSPSPTGLTMHFDLLVTGDEAVGSIVWTDAGTGSGTARVRLVRAP